MTQQYGYLNDITREIDGVIKAESDKRLKDEISEYVVTAEQMRPNLLPSLFKGLQKDGTNNCVWISGDFGSGKSHLLKVLSYVLENRVEIDGEKCAVIFAEKCKEDPQLKRLIENACEIPTVSILFNIQKNLDATATKGIDPVLMIFLKVFNSRLGYDDKKPAVAEIERYFASQGKYEWLKSEYRARFGKEWIADRPSIYYKLHNLAEIFADMENIDKETAYNNLRTQIDHYTIDSDGFVKLVRNYLDQHPGSRLIFFVDEVGQFIGTDISRMLSLQTIAEGLGDATDGRASIMVTSQMDIDATVGDLTRRQANDFSRIQGRFTQRINLTSANADEVIQRRILEKTPDAKKILKNEYEKQRNVIKSLLQFGEESQFRSNYKSADEFAADFPFVDYQFNLLQQSIINLSKNNAFTGEQNSVGERSLLSVTHQVANDYKDFDFSRIVQFSDMYEGIRSQLQTKIHNDIIQAENTLGDELALKVLKTLFMLKYVAGFPTNVDNITKILLPSFDTDYPDFKSEIQEALNKLVRQSYIDKGAKDDYHFQTNEEKDIENEIKAQELTPDAVNKELMKIFRDEIFSENKIKLTPYKIFSYGRYVDDDLDGRESDLYIHFVTSNSGQDITDDEKIRNYSFRHPDQLCVILAEDRYLTEDLTMMIKADKCLNRLLQNSDGYRLHIISDKRKINSRRKEAIAERLTQATKSARLFLNGQEVDTRATDLKNRLNEGMSVLVKNVFTNLDMLSIECDDDRLRRIITEPAAGSGDESMIACMNEVFNKIKRDKTFSVRTKVSDLVSYFKGKPYGWYETATLCILAKLFKLDKISFRNGGSVVEQRDLYTMLTNSISRQTLIVDVEEVISANQIAALKNQYRDLFDDESCRAQGAKDVHTAFINRLNDEIRKIRDTASENRYEFTKPLSQVISHLSSLSNSVYPGLYGKKNEIEDAIDLKEDVVEPIINFVGSRQYDIFKNLNRVLSGNQANFAYVAPEILKALESINESEKPWSKMNEAKSKLDELKQEIDRRQKEERQKLIAEIDSKYDTIRSLPAFATLKPDQSRQIDLVFDTMKQGVQNERFIGNLIAYSSKVTDHYNNCLDTINRWVEIANKNIVEAAEKEEGKASQEAISQPMPARTVKKVVNKQKALNIPYPKNILETKEDVEAYIKTLRTQLMDYINKDTSIMLN